MLPAVLLLLAKATIVLVVALGITRALPRAPAGARHLVWLTALAALLLVPAIARWAPLRVGILPPWPALQAVTTRVAIPTSSAATDRGAPAARRATPDAHATPGDAAAAGTGAAASDTAVVGAAAPARRVVGVVPSLLALWAAVVLAIGGSLVSAWVAVRRVVRRARPLDTPAWRDPLWEIADRLGLAEPPRLLRSEAVGMPFACGLRRPTVVLPAASDTWTPDRRRAVLLHELAHVRRRDLVGHTLARVVCAVYWFHPLVWTAARRLRAESERACDDVALACGACPADYAEHLLDIVIGVRRDTTPAVALAMARRTEFEGRMLDILDAERSRATPSRRQLVPLVGVLALVTVVVSAAPPTSVAPTSTATTPAPPAFEAHTPASAVLEAHVTAPSVPRVPVMRVPVVPKPAPNMPSMPNTAGATTDTGRAGAAGAPAVSHEAQPTRAAARPAPGPDTGSGDWHDGAVRATVAAVTPRSTDAIRAVVPRPTARGVSSDLAAQDHVRGHDRAELLARVLRADTSASVRRTAAWGLSEYASLPVAAAALVTALGGDRSADVREMAAWSLAEGAHDAAARDALVAALRGDARVRATAAWALGTRDERGAADALAAALGGADPQVRARAVWALGTLGPRPAPRALVARLGDPDAHVRRLTAWALFTIGDPATAPALQNALRTERDPELQVAYVRALGALGEQSVDVLRGLLDSPDPRIRTVAVRALAGGRASGPWPWPWPQPRPFP